MLLLETWELFYNISGVMSLGFIDEVSGGSWYLACKQTSSSGQSPYRTSEIDGRNHICFDIKRYSSKTLSTYNLLRCRIVISGVIVRLFLSTSKDSKTHSLT